MAKKKKNGWFGFGGKKKKKTKAQVREAKDTMFSRIRIGVWVVSVAVVLAGAGVGFWYMDGYVKGASPVAASFGPVKINQPVWFNPALSAKIEDALGGTEFKLNDDTAREVAERLERLSWLYDVKATRKDKTVDVVAKYRKPVALLRLDGKRFYVDENLKVIDYLPMDKLAIVEVKGFGKLQQRSHCKDAEDIESAVKLVVTLAEMDRRVAGENPLLSEIESVDVSNFGGRKDSKRSQLTLIAKDGTVVLWGAPIGDSARYFEAPDKEKLNALYGYYKQRSTLQGKDKFIELRYPEKTIPRP